MQYKRPDIIFFDNIDKHVARLKGTPLIVSDENTHAELGERLEHEITSHTSLVLQSPKANFAFIDAIKGAAKHADYIIAVGSGTINDLCKYASYTLGKPYIVCPTAPSMNGYISANASLVGAGETIKSSHKAHLPAKVFVDMNVIANAPLRLIQAGIGDSICVSTAHTDWLFSHLVKQTPYTEEPFVLLQPYQKYLLDTAFIKRVISRNKDALQTLMEILFTSGWGMCIAGGSYPASQGEHMIAHTMEMLYGDALPPKFHGEQIGVTTLTMAEIQEREVDKQPADIRDALSHVMIPSEMIHDVLEEAGNPTTPEALGWTEEQYRHAIEVAPSTRDRYTFLSL